MQEERYKSGPVSNAAIVFTLLAFEYSFSVTDTVWISGSENWKADELSRVDRLGRPLTQVVQDMGYEENLICRAENFPSLRSLLSLMNPAREIASEARFNEYWGLVVDEIAKFRGAGME